MVDTTQRFTPDLAQATADNSYYALTMFPYPSGSGLHAGHASVFTINDVAARFQRMQGKVVFNPFGFDSFGLPTENYAMKQGRPAYEITEENKAHFLRQVQALNISFDYERLVTTSQADYYKRTQWIFAKLYDAGLAYRDELWVNRCPDCQTVLANDQVVDGKCERCKNEIIQKKMPQWFIKITDYADRLIADLDTIDRPEETKTAQRNWIGRSEGAEIIFEVVPRHSEGETTEESGDSIQDSSLRSEGQFHTIKCFTTRPDTIYGVTAVVLAPENTDFDDLLSVEKREEVEVYRQKTLAKTSVQRQQDAKEKTGVESGFFVKHPLTDEKISVRYADYVLADYGSGAVMMVPAHDERDFEFAKKYGIEIKQVIKPPPTPLGERGEQEQERFFDFQENEQYIKDSKLITNGKHLPYNPNLKERAKEMRKNMTVSESKLRKEYLQGLEVNVLRQKPLDHYIVDFYIASKRIIIEVDGSAHRSEDAIKYDQIRDEVLSRYGLEVIRLSNTQINNNFQSVKEQLDKKLSIDPPSSFKEGARGGFIEPYTGKDGVLVNSGEFDGLDYITAKKKITQYLESQGKGERKITYRLRDRSVSRQRYWGSPIPVYYEPKSNPKVPFQRYTSGIWTFKENEPVMSRKTIAGVLIDPNTGKYAIIKRLGLEEENYTLVLGGIDEGETGEQAAYREIHEETGYKNIKLIKKLGDFQTEFWHAVKKRNQHNSTQCYLFELIDHKNDGGAQEENENLEVVWMSKEELPVSKYDMFRDYFLNLAEGKEVTREGEWINIYNQYNLAPIEVCEKNLIPESELPVNLPLDVENYKPKGKSPLEEHPTFPYYTPYNGLSIQEDGSIQYTYTESSKRFPKENAETKSRENVLTIIKSPKGEYLLCHHTGSNVVSFPGGGIEPGDSKEETVRKEILEETGYTNITEIKEVGAPIHSTFYHRSKKVNMQETCYVYLVTLGDLTQEEISKHEQDKHTMVWTSKDQVDGLLSSEYLKFVWNRAAGGSDQEYIHTNTGNTYLRECDTLDTFMCSAFYFLRYPNVGDDTQLISKALADKLFPVDLYLGGKEHTVGHLLYSRFIHKFLYDQGYVSSPEPFAKLVHQGMVLGNDGRKMGKRYGNGVDPLEIVEEFGADAVRTYLMFMGPVEQDKIRNEGALNGVKKFLARVERLTPKTGMDMRVSDNYLMQSPDAQELAQQEVISAYHQTIIDITGDFEKLKYNTAVSKIMILVNTIYEQGIAPHEVLLGLTKFIALFATDLGDRMRLALGQTDDVQFGNRPIADESKIVVSSITLPVQINGKVRANIEISPGTTEEDVMKLAQAQDNVQKYLDGKKIRKVIYIQDKILNIVIG